MSKVRALPSAGDSTLWTPGKSSSRTSTHLSARPTPTKMKRKDAYIPALNYHWLTRFYDPLVMWLMPEQRIKSDLVLQAGIAVNHLVIDVGCGTGTLALLAKRHHPTAQVGGIDADPRILAIAQRKVSGGPPVALFNALSNHLPFAKASIDRVLTSLMLHHLNPVEKNQTLKEIYRVLTPEGELHIADFGRSSKSLTGDLEAVGFHNVEMRREFSTVFGKVCLWRADKAVG